MDYKNFTPNGAPSDAAPNSRWWLSDKKDLAGEITKVITTLASYDSRRQTQYQVSTRLYGNMNLMGLNGLSYARVQTQQNTMRDRITYNVVQSTIDTITAKMAKNKPEPLFLTKGGDYKMQRRAKKLDKFVEGTFYENKAYTLGPDVFKDACIFGDGFVHVYEENTKNGPRVRYERVIPSELYVDQMEAYYGHPKQLHRVKNVDRGVLMEAFPEHKKAIKQANSAIKDVTGTYQNIADEITVAESWHLPSGPNSGDGLHTIIMDQKSLLVEEWDNDFFPFAKFSWCKRPYGWYGQGLAEQEQSIQLEMNKLLWVFQRSMHLAGTQKILMENGSKISKEHFTNDLGLVLTYANTPPQYIVPPIVPPEMYTHFERLKNLAFESAGISMLSAAAQKPAGLNSGKALREFNDIESDRFMIVGQAYETFFMDLGKLSVWKAKEIYSREKHYSVVYPDKRFIETIDWKDIDLEESDYVLQCFPVSSLPNEPAGRLQTIQEYTQAGMISPRKARRLLEFPDLEQDTDLATSQEDYVHMILEKIIDSGEYTPPEPFDDLNLCKELALEYYAQGKNNGLEEEKLEQLRTFMAQVDVLVQKSIPPPPPMMAPQAVPAAPPVSQLIQNTPQAMAS